MPTALQEENSVGLPLWPHWPAALQYDIHAQHAGEPIAAAKFRKNQIAVCAERFAQCVNLKFEVVLRYHHARPHSADELFFRDERAIGSQKDQQDIQGAPAELDWPAVSEQLPPSQQDAETAEFEIRAGGGSQA
jgi:hypothetical protein